MEPWVEAVEEVEDKIFVRDVAAKIVEIVGEGFHLGVVHHDVQIALVHVPEFGADVHRTYLPVVKEHRANVVPERVRGVLGADDLKNVRGDSRVEPGNNGVVILYLIGIALGQ